MFQSAEFRLATLAFAGLAVWLASSPACAFSQENLRSGEVGNPAFADPGDQVKNFGTGARPFGPNGPIVQFGAHRGPLNPFGRFQGNNYNPPPEPYARPLGNGD